MVNQQVLKLTRSPGRQVGSAITFTVSIDFQVGSICPRSIADSLHAILVNKSDINPEDFIGTGHHSSTFRIRMSIVPRCNMRAGLAVETAGLC
ncbi:hypothetical protein GALL_286860 [mine drainage metagenome]|uniref:Uncharacterized protein n=1 Tax=mine drainage metagenome TaxID=410659 RepID=A0A1J5R0E9_9ZZZZ